MEPKLDETRQTRGLAKLAEVAGPAGAQVAAPLGDLGRYIVEFVYGDIYRRDGLSLRQREMVTVAVLTALGRETQLRVHLSTALRAGLSAAELEETIIQTVPFAGFPTAINALTQLKQLVADVPLAGQEQPVQAGAFVYFVEVRERAAGVQFAAIVGISGWPLHVIQQTLHKIGSGSEVLKALLILDADGFAAEIVGDA